MRFILRLLAALAALIALLRSVRGIEPGDDWIPSPPKRRKWLTCGKGSGERASEPIGPDGGKVTLHGHVLSVPAGAVTRETRFTLREAPTPQILVVATCAGRFEGKLSLTISWEERCGPGAKPRDPRIYRREDMEDLHGEVRGQTITTDRIGRLSGFMVAIG